MAFVVTSGQIAAVQNAERYLPAGFTTPRTSIQVSTALTMTYAQIWRTQPALRTVVGFLARNVAQLGIDVYERASATDRRKLPDHPAARLLERPFPGSKLTKYRLINTLMHDLCIYDDAFILKVKTPGGTPGLMPISPTVMAPQGSQWFESGMYRLTGSTGIKDVRPENVIHIHGYNPDDARVGVAPIETLRRILAEEYSATQYREQLWRNGARVAGYVARPKDAGKWSDDARKRFAASWQSQYAGDGGPGSGGTPVLEDGMSFVPSGVSPKDAQYVESRKLTREEVAVAFHVSPSMVGLMEGTNFSSIQELHTMMYQDTLAPYLTQIAQDLENQLLEDLDPSAKDGNLYLEFNLSEKLRGSFKDQASAIQSAVGAPWLTRAEARGMFNLPELDGADELIVPLNVLEGGLASPNDTAPDNPSDEGNPKARLVAGIVRKAYARQEQAVGSRLEAGTADVFDRSRWDAELADDLMRAGVTAVSARLCARRLNDLTQSRLASALTGTDPKAAARRVFADLTEGAR